MQGVLLEHPKLKMFTNVKTERKLLRMELV